MNVKDPIRWAVNYSKERLCQRIEQLEAENNRLLQENEVLQSDLRSATSQLHALETEYQVLFDKHKECKDDLEYRWELKAGADY